MRCLHRNKRKFYYALFKEKFAIKDEYGNDSGEYKVVYESPIEMKANVSAATGEAQVEQFGNSLLYDKVICIDSPPAYDKDGNLIYDYIVKKVARSLNTVSFAVSKVEVS